MIMFIFIWLLVKYMISLFLPWSSSVERVQSRITHCSIAGCDNKQVNNSEVTHFNLPKDPQRRKSSPAAISNDKDSLP